MKIFRMSYLFELTGNIENTLCICMELVSCGERFRDYITCERFGVS